jgi:hypothetical protein
MSLLDFIGLPQIYANGVALVSRRALNIVGGSVVDDPINQRTVVNVGGGGGGPGASDTDGVTNLSPNVPGATVTQALNWIATELAGRATTSALSAVLAVANSKASQAALDALSGTVAGKAAQTALDALTATVANKANQSALDALTTTVGTKAAQTAVDALTTAVGTKAPNDAVYLVATLSSGLTAERVLSGADGCTVDYTTPGQAIVRGQTAATGAPVGAQYLVGATDATLTAERVLSGADGCTVDYGTPGQAIVRGPTIPASATPAEVAALRTPVYLVQTATSELDNERTLQCTAPVAADWATAGKVTLSMAAATTSTAGHMTAAHATALAAARVPTYIVQTATADLDNERVLTGADGCTVDYATPGQAIVRGPSIPAAATPGDVAALKAPVYIVQTATTALDNERVLQCTAPVAADWATAGQVTISMPAATTSTAGHMTAAHATTLAAAATATQVAALRTPVYLVQTATTELDNERVLSCTAPVAANWATAGQVTISMPAATTSVDGYMTAVQATALAGKADKAWTDNPQAGAYTLAATDGDRLTRMTSATAVDCTVPPIASVTVPVMTPVNVLRYGTGPITIKAGAGVNLLPSNNLRLANQYDMATLTRITGDTWIVKGEVTT